MSAQSTKNVANNLIRAVITNTHMTDNTGARIFMYRPGLYYLMGLISVLLVIAVAYDPPTKPADILISILLISSAIFMCVQAGNYRLIFIDNTIIRISPWPWHKHNDFDINQISVIDIKYKAMHVSLMMTDGRELRVPIMLKGAFLLVHSAGQNSSAIIPEKVRTIIEYYSRL